MAYLHSFGVLHGDLTGNNVLLTASSKDTRRWTTAVADFGLSRFAGASLHSAPYGTVTHMPPEVLAGAPLSPPSDVWSFGTLLWEMLSGCRAWGWLSYHQVLHAAATHTPLPMDHLALLSPELRRIVADCLAVAPAERPSFEQLLQRLTKILKDVARKAQGDQARREA
ncbi:hypothetical protein H632_c4930p0 [Helicosporidium sp. ATCC 50920]|nr:hypothetical protein H632_c4930p0 [Helicosporidium sp. ATCC 50920]|eukprot:KDD71488.1 hypothetical protein H632_c4930p0 [Helicosporidium sp. ATCC 50920]